jgi:hypothetical protein
VSLNNLSVSKIGLLIILTGFASACASTQKQLPKVSHDGLELVEDTTLGAGYVIVDGAAEDVLVLRPAIINLDITAPDTMSPGMTRTFTASAGEMTLYMEFFDSTTSAILGRVVDAEASRDLGGVQISNRVTNIAEADRILRKWADIPRQKLDEVHGKSAS